MSDEWKAATVLASLPDAEGRTVEYASVSAVKGGKGLFFMRFTDGAILVIAPHEIFYDGDEHTTSMRVCPQINVVEDLHVGDAVRMGLCRDEAHYWEMYEAARAAKSAASEALERRHYEKLKAKFEGKERNDL